MKKVLVLSLVLVMALAGSAFAAVDFSGEFSATIENDGGYLEGLAVTPGFKIDIGASAGNDLDWSFEADSSLEDDTFQLGEYKLELNDNYFDLFFWGNGKELSDKGSALDLFKAAKKADDHRARLVVDAIEPVTLTADFTQSMLYVFADANIEGYDVGAAFKKNSDVHTFGVYGQGDVDIVTLKADVAATLVEKVDEESDEEDATTTGVALGYGVRAEVQVTDEVDVWAQYKGMQEDFDGSSDKSKVSVGGTYADALLEVDGSVAQDFDAESNEISLGAKYRFSDTVGYGDLFDDDHWYENDAPAVGLSTKLVDLGLDNVTLDAASPVVEDMVWVRGKVVYAPETVEAEEEDDEDETTHNFTVNVDGRVLATDKLTVMPAVGYVTADKELDLQVAADYLIGDSGDVTLGLEVGRTMELVEEGDVSENLKASVTVKF